MTKENFPLLEQKIKDYIISQVIKLKKGDSSWRKDQNFSEMGIQKRQLSQLIEEEVGITLSPTLFFECENIEELSFYFFLEFGENFSAFLGTDQKKLSSVDLKKRITNKQASEKNLNEEKSNERDIAVIGMAGRFAQAKNLKEFWKKLKSGTNFITEIPPGRWNHDLWFNPNGVVPNKTYSKWGSFLDNVDKFDPSFFSISPREATWMDPQLRLLLEVVHQTIQDAGYEKNIYGTNTGLYVASAFKDYWDEILRQQIPIDSPYEYISNMTYMLSGRVSYTYDLQGPSVPVDNACASGITGIHLAVQSLRENLCDMAIVAGVNLILSPIHYVFLSQISALSPTGRCHAFSKNADGYVPGEGVMALLLKPLKKAITDRDNIHAVIKGSAINHVGRSNSLYSPRPKLQAQVIQKAWKDAQISPLDIGLIETHGTGTRLGDPIEVQGLTRAFRDFTKTKDKHFCALGAVKSQIGHLEGASGLAGVIKAILSLKNKKIIGVPSYDTPNPLINLENTPFFIPTTNTVWKQKKGLRKVGVSAFGITGNNAHVVIEEYKEKTFSKKLVGANDSVAILLSAKSKRVLFIQAKELLAAIKDQSYSECDLINIAYTLQVGRKEMKQRLGIIAYSISELEKILEAFVQKKQNIENLYQSDSFQDNSWEELKSKEEFDSTIDQWIQNRKYQKILNFWIKGLSFDWERLYQRKKPKRISLPSYPFLGERYWISNTLTNSTSSHLDPSLSTERKKSEIVTLAPQNKDYALEKLNKPKDISLSSLSLFTFENVFSSTKGEDSLSTNLYNCGKGIFVVQILELQTQNILSDILIQELGEALAKVEKEESAKVLILTGTDSHFLSGGRTEQNEVIKQKLHQKIASFPFPTIAAMEGNATGAGFLIGILCDFMICSEENYYYYTSSRDEFFPSEQEKSLFIERFGKVQTEDFLYLGNGCTGRQLQDKGWSCPILPKDQVDRYAQELATTLAEMPQESLRHLKKHLSRKIHPCVKELKWQEEQSKLETKGEVLLIRINSSSLPVDLKMAFSQTQYQAIVITSTHPQFFPIDLQELLINSKTPLIAAIESDLKDSAWLMSLFCDVCIYNESSVYSYQMPNKEAVELFSLRFGHYLAKEILLTRAEYTGKQLQERLKTLKAVPAGQVVPTALQVAKSWCHQKRGILKKINVFPIWKEKNEKVVNTATQVSLNSKVVKAKVYPPGILVVKMIEREAKNMFSKAFIEGITEIFEHIEKNPVYRVIVLTGYDSYFASGGTKEVLEAIQKGTLKYSDLPIYELPKQCKVPVISAMQGHGIGAGWTLGMFSDFVIFSEESLYSTRFMSFGFTPGAGSTLVFPHKIGCDLGREVLFTAKEYKGSELKMRGILMPVLPRKQVYDSAMALAQKVAQISRPTLINLKEQFTQNLSKQLQKTYELELEMHAKTFVSNSQTLSQIQKKFNQDISKTTNSHSQKTNFAISDDSENDILLSIKSTLKNLLAKELHLSNENIEEDTPFVDLGLDSITGVTWIRKINQEYGVSISATKVYDYPTLFKLSQYVKKEVEGVLLAKTSPTAKSYPTSPLFSSTKKISFRNKSERIKTPEMASSCKESGIAIIGMACKFPQAKNVEKFWKNIESGQDCISEIPKHRWKVEDYCNPKAKGLRVNDYKWMGVLEEHDLFDPMFFNISPEEAQWMDPQQRVFLESAWSCIEDAGIHPKILSSHRCGVFVGCTAGDYCEFLPKHERGSKFLTGTSSSILSARISYLLNLKGPCLSIDTACSSSLVAISEACNSLMNQTSDFALAGGVCVLSGPSMHIMTSQSNMLSKDGHCFTFDSRANGFVPGEGTGVLLLKRVDDALQDQDSIYGVIRGWGINQDGKTNGITAPSVNSQLMLEKEVYDRFEIHPETISLVEAHGTGTKLGDPIEVEALIKSFRGKTSQKQFCALGSVKSNIGHLLAASGVSGVIKVLLCLKHKKLVPSVNFKTLNPHISLNDSPFFINTKLQDWNSQTPRRAAVSSFGFSGTNAHLVIEEAPSFLGGSTFKFKDFFLVPISAKNKVQLRIYVEQIYLFLQEKEPLEYRMEDIAYTLQIGRLEMEERVIFLVKDRPDLVKKLSSFLENQESIKNCYSGSVKRKEEDLATLFEDEDMTATIAAWIQKKKYSKLMKFWGNGLYLDWNQLYGEVKPRRISLPTYPFARERYWISEAQDNKTVLEPDVFHTFPFYENKEESVDNFLNKKNPNLLDLVNKYLQSLLLEITKIPFSKLSIDTPFEEWGLDSIMISTLNQKIEQRIGKMDTTLFFKYRTIQDLGEHLSQTYPERLAKVFSKESSTLVATGSDTFLSIKQPESKILQRTLSSSQDSQSTTDIAIIGIAGRYPKSETLDQFWNNLYEGKDCISEIPRDRWPLEGFFDKDRVSAVEKRLSYSKWGGFLEKIDCFDPLFFNISPREAETMDPQERLFLETAWNCLEDSGYTRKSLKREGNQIGVFAGVTFNNYQLLTAESAYAQGDPFYPVNSQTFSIANRVSYVMDLTGPSLTVDTACSSSLYAIHLACESIRSGQSTMAFAGGINLSLHPSKYITLSQSQFGASDGRCRAFSEGGTGYVPAEAVGVVFFKPLALAIEDQDLIYGVIKGTACSHGGRTNGYTVPNPISQSLAIERALLQSDIDPLSISCIEAHGTGTMLGDPIEIQGLTDVFQKYTSKKQFCSISSAKSNIGHAEAAAGIVQLTKVLLQFKHKTLVKNVMHGKILNPNIHFEETPFYVQKETQDWNPTIDDKKIPRRAGISSFGAGGANAHIVVEEYSDNEGINSSFPSEIHTSEPVIVLISARTKKQLEKQVKNLQRFLHYKSAMTNSLVHLPSLAFTLQVGREAMDERLGLIVSSLAGLEKKLEDFLAGSREREGMYLGQVKRDKENLSMFIVDKDLQQAMDSWIDKRKYSKILELWTKGLAFDWNKLYKETKKPKRINLPTYPFAREKYWIPGLGQKRSSLVSSKFIASMTHPMLHENTSGLSERQLNSMLRGKEYFSGYYKVKPKRVSLPTYPFSEEKCWITGLKNKKSNSLLSKPDSRISVTPPLLYENREMQEKSSANQNSRLTDTVNTYLQSLFSEVTKVSSLDIMIDDPFEELGLDSIMIVDLNRKMEERIGKIDPTIFFKHKTIQELGYYLLQNYPEKLAKHVDFSQKDSSKIYSSYSLDTEKDEISSIKEPISKISKDDRLTMDIAIIGVSGRYPKSETLDQFWNNLCQGKDCISEIPKDRWPLEGFFDHDRVLAVEKGLSYSKWGGFLEKIDCFDPMFFNISPKEAEMMDPQERLFLETAWHCLENAGYTRESLERNGHGNKIGVFAGVTFNSYQLLMAESAYAQGKQFYPVNSQTFSIANRISYFMNLTGPSLTVDTACSSSLYAIHLACESLRTGQSRMAFAGGVNLSIHPSKYITLSQGQFSASDGRCRAFTEGGTGYVPSEGVGVVFLKPLSLSIEDRDIVYGVIKGTACSHGGKTNGYTVPNPVSQSFTIEQALLQSKINPSNISCIEAHGTGTALGDPIEIQGLTDVFQKYTTKKQFCSISSSKSNIGHAEAAAGIAQLTKVLLQFKYKMLVKNVMHGKTLNPNILFKDTPFYVQKENKAWNPIINGQKIPRIAGINSFGAGGANAHIIVQEYSHNDRIEKISTLGSSDNEPVLILISARTKKQLEQKMKDLQQFLQNKSSITTPLTYLQSLAYTLQVGREAMKERLGILVHSISELEGKLEGVLAGDRSIEGMYFGKVKRDKETLSLFGADEDLQQTVESWVKKGKYSKILNLWVKGLALDWNKLYPKIKPKRINLPVYPFAKERYWVSKFNQKRDNFLSSKPMLSLIIHPLVHESIPSLPKQEQNSNFKREKFTLRAPKTKLKRISLPTYPFTEKKCWILQPSRKKRNPLIPPKLEKFNSAFNLSEQRLEKKRSKSLRLLQKLQSRQSSAYLNEKLLHEKTMTARIPNGNFKSIAKKIRKVLNGVLALENDQVDAEVSFGEIGLSSIILVTFIEQLNDEFGLNLQQTIVFDHPNILALTNYIASEIKKNGKNDSNRNGNRNGNGNRNQIASHNLKDTKRLSTDRVEKLESDEKRKTENIFGTYYSENEATQNVKFPDNSDYLRENNVFSYNSRETQIWKQRYTEKINKGEKVLLLGFQSLAHNSGVSLIETSQKEGIRILANYEEERFAAKKHFAGYPKKSIEELKRLLTKIGKTGDDIFCILYAWDVGEEEKNDLKSFILKKKITQNELYVYLSRFVGAKIEGIDKQSQKNFHIASPSLVKVYQQLTKDLNLKQVIPCIQMSHHENHAYFSYGVSPFFQEKYFDQTIMISCIDGNGDAGSTSLYTAKGTKIDLIKRLSSENSLGVFYMLCSSFLGGWTALSAEGRYMGAAAWGNCSRLTNPYYKRLREYFHFSNDGQIHTNSSLTANEYSGLQDILGPFLRVEDLWNPDLVLNVDNVKHTKINRERVDKAAAVQMVFEDALFHMIAFMIDQTGSDKLVLCGGTALNCVANMRLLQHFDKNYYRRYLGKDAQLNIWIPPVPSDQGVVVGAPYQFAMKNGVKPEGKLPSPFLCGLPPSTNKIRETLDKTDFVFYEELGNINDQIFRKELVDWMAYIVSENGIIGIYQGSAETGPRALGHRSFLANPCNPDTLQILNDKVKLRERIRPLAPMVTLEEAKKWFHLSEGGSSNGYDAYNYMVLTVEVKEEARKVIPAVIHHDSTSRIQIVRPENNSLIHEYLKALKKYIGVEISVNTSLNIGSPIVQTPSQAIEIFKRAQGLDCIFMIGEEGDAFMVWAKKGIQKFDSHIVSLSKAYSESVRS